MPEGIRLFPQNVRFFELFASGADHALNGARLLLDMLETGQDIERKARHLKDIEHAGDENTHEIFRGLSVSFVTPLDREDISELATALDDVLDWTEDASRRIRLYKELGAATPESKQLARVLVDQAEQLAKAVRLLASAKHAAELEQATREIHRLENEGDDLFATVLARLYDGITEVPALIRAMRWGDIYQVMETATDKAEHAAVVMRNIALKHH